MSNASRASWGRQDHPEKSFLYKHSCIPCLFSFSNKLPQITGSVKPENDLDFWFSVLPGSSVYFPFRNPANTLGMFDSGFKVLKLYSGHKKAHVIEISPGQYFQLQLIE